MLAPLKVPPGAFANGTEYEARGRWHDVNLVRWLDGSLRPIGGWTQWGTGTFSGIARGSYSWTDNTGNRWFAFGTAAKLYVSDDEAQIFDITPTSGFTVGAVSAANTGTGYGKSLYGRGNYGTPRPDTGAIALATTWAMDGFGQYLVCCSDADGKLLLWQINTANKAAAITNAPTGCTGVVVTEERFVFALGAGGDTRTIQWPDQENYTTWTPEVTNQAGSYSLETDGEIRCGIKVPGETLILTSTDLWRARYIGSPLVYSFSRVDTGCGAPGNRTAIKIGNRAVWLGYGGFFLYDGSVRKLQCDIWDLYISRRASIQTSKIFGWHNIDYQEAVWLIPSDSENECDFYITWNYAENWWSVCDIGSFDRSAGVASRVFALPLLCGTDGKLYRHEYGYVYGNETPYAKSGPIEIGNGERRMHVTKLYPDEDTLASTVLTFYAKEYPTANEVSHGPYSMANPTSVRFSGRQVAIKVNGSGNTAWKFGIPRIDITSGGQR
jgi:hypothetical protein